MSTPRIIITDEANCIVDGVNIGAPADAIINRPDLAAAIETALAAYRATPKPAALPA